MALENFLHLSKFSLITTMGVRDPLILSGFNDVVHSHRAGDAYL